MKRLEGVRILFPRQVNLRARLDTAEGTHIPELGRMEDMRVTDPHAMEMTFIANTEAGEFLADALAQGKAGLEMSFNMKVAALPGQPQPLALMVRWLDAGAHATWLFRFGHSSILAGIGNR